MKITIQSAIPDIVDTVFANLPAPPHPWMPGARERIIRRARCRCGNGYRVNRAIVIAAVTHAFFRERSRAWAVAQRARI